MALSKRRHSNASRDRSNIERAEKREYPAHRKWLRGFACVVCESLPQRPVGKIECAHVRLGTDGGTGLKPHDAYCLPLCAGHHDKQHDIGEASFALRYCKAFPRGMKAKALEYASKSPVVEIRDRAEAELRKGTR